MNGPLPVPDATGGLFAAAVAALAALATLAGVGGLTLDRRAGGLREAAARVTVAVADADPGRQATRARALAAMLGARSDLRGVRAVGAGALKAELAPWLGRRAALPLPALIDATLIGDADEQGVRRALAGLPGVAVTRDGAELRPLADALRALAGIALGVTAAAVAGSGAFAVLAARAAFARDEDAIAVLRRLGARDGQIAAALQRRAGGGALLGGVCGLVAGGAAIPFIAARAGTIHTDGMADALIAPSGWLLPAALPVALAAVAMAATRATALLLLARRR